MCLTAVFGARSARDLYAATKSGKVGSGGKVVKVVVAISYGKGAIVCHQYHKLDRAYFAEFVQDNFENMFRTANKNGS